MSGTGTSWWRRRLRSAGRERGMVEAGIAAAGGLLVVGAVVGNGVAAAVMDMSDGQTWLPSDDGTVVQVNPATGQPEFRLEIGEDGDRLEVTQSDGFLVVTNVDTGVMTTIDLAGLVAGRSRQVAPETEILIGGGLMVVAEKEPGFLQVVDPISGAGIGAAHRVGEDLADVVIDREGSVWLVTESGDLQELDYVPEAGSFSVSTDRPVSGAGPATRLVPHASGVTLFAPDGGAVLQIGAGTDYVQQVPALRGEVHAATLSPSTLAPASATDAGLVVMVSGRQLLTVDVGGLGCERPLAPAVLEQRVYVPCAGEGVVMVLDAQGNRAAKDIVVPGGGDAQLLVDDGRLVIHDPEDPRIVVVQQDGSTQVTDLDGVEVPVGTPDVSDPLPPVSLPGTVPPVTVTPPPVDIDPPPVRNPTDPPTNGPPDTGAPPGTDPDPDDDPSSDPGDGGDPGDGTEVGDEDLVPTDVRAEVQGDGSVRLSWSAPVTAPREYVVTSSDGAVEQTLPVSQTEVVLTTLTCGSDLSLRVLAHHTDGTFAAGRATVTTPDCTDPVDPAELTPTAVEAERAGIDVVVRWSAPPVAPDRYVVTGMGLTRTVDGADTSLTLAGVPCGEPIRFEVTAVHPDQGEHSATSTTTTETCQQDPADLQPTNVALAVVDEATLRLTWTAPVERPRSFVISGGGVNQSVAGGATTATIALPCGPASVALTITAQHLNGDTGEGTSNTVAHTCTPPAAPGAPTNVTATHTGGNQVQVSWTAGSPAADEYVVIPSSGGSVSAGGATNATLTVAPGGTYTFTVEARLNGRTATSAPSNAVTVAAPSTVPDAPGNLQASVDHQTSMTNHTVTWTAPADGGSPLTGYTLIWDGRTIPLGPGATSWSESVPCDPCQMMPMVPDFDVSLSATNAVGTGATATTIPGFNPPPPPPQPQDGDAVLTKQEGLDGETRYTGTITYEPSATWAGIGGTCTASENGGPAVTIDCATSAVVGTFSGPRHVGMDGEVTVTITWPGGTASTSQSVSMPGEGYCYYENGTRHCINAASLDPSDPDVEIDPLPWTPPDVPNPPVLVAGAGLLLGAGTLRTLRALRRRGLLENPSATTSPDRGDA